LAAATVDAEYGRIRFDRRFGGYVERWPVGNDRDLG
jgi:hypothetical protein